MKKSQVNRARIAERADARGLASGTRGTLGTNPALRAMTKVEPGGNPRRTHGAAKGAGSGSKGYRSEWAMSPYPPFGGWQ